MENFKSKEMEIRSRPRALTTMLMIDKTSSKIRAQKNRLEHLSDRQSKTRDCRSNYARASMMLLFQVDTKCH